MWIWQIYVSFPYRELEDGPFVWRYFQIWALNGNKEKC